MNNKIVKTLFRLLYKLIYIIKIISNSTIENMPCKIKKINLIKLLCKLLNNVHEKLFSN